MITHANLSHLHKILYPFGMQDVLYEDCTLAGLVKKSAKFEGESFVVPLKYSPGHKSSSDFAEAQTNHSRSRGTRFIYTDSFKHYGVFQMSTEAIKRAKGGAGSFRNAVKDEIDSTLHDMSKDIAAGLYGNGGGALAQVAAFDTTGNGTITLVDPADVIHFEVGMRIQPATTDGTSGSVIADIVAIATIDRDLGTLALAAAPGNDANWAAPNYLFKAGNFGVQPAGLGAHVPAAAPSATLFRGVDRSVDVQRLGGCRYVGDPNVDGTIVRAVQNAVSKTKRLGAWARPDTVLAGTGVYQQILNESEDKTVIKKDATALGGKAGIGYEGVAIQVGKAGKLNVFEDAFCPEDTVWALRLDTWEIAYVPDMWMALLTEAGDGGKLSIYNADGVEWRYASMWDLVCHAPGANCRIDVSDLIAA